MIVQPKPMRIRDTKYLKFVREQGCIFFDQSTDHVICVCGRSHTIKFSIAERVVHPFQGYDYKCPETNKDASARLA